MSGPAGREEFLELGVQFCRLGVHADVSFPDRFRHGFLLFWPVLRLRDLGWVLLPLNVQENSRVRYRGVGKSLQPPFTKGRLFSGDKC